MRKFALGLAASFFSLLAVAGDTDSTKLLRNRQRTLDSLDATFRYQTGKVMLANGLATLNVGKGYKFLDSADARRLLEDVWGNMKGQTALGLIVPADAQAAVADYAFVVEYEPIGYVKDEDADDINYDDLLKQMKKEAIEANDERRKTGVAALFLEGWAAQPRYDKSRKILHWAKELRVEGAEGEHTLNYDVRVLGRKGVLVLQAVSGISQLPAVNGSINNILGMVSFNEGNRYQDFDSKVDDVAAWTIGGLVAGKVLAKVGILALLLKNIKLVLLALAAFGGAIWRFVTGKRKKQEELSNPEAEPEPATAQRQPETESQPQSTAM